MTIREFFPPGYDPTLDRLPPRRINCRGLLILLALIPLLACGGVVFFLSQQPTSATIDSGALATVEVTEVTAAPTLDGWIATGTALALVTPTQTSSPTPDDWQLTGTALALATATATPSPEPTQDYCWFLTPSATPSSTPVFVTPDRWAMTGTAIFRESNTATPEVTATQPPPRAWCDEALVMLLNPTATPTLGAPTMLPTFTWVPQPTQQQIEQQPQIIYVTQEVAPPTAEIIYITTEPQPPIYIQPPPIVVTQPVYIQQPPIVITATPLPATATYTATHTATASHTPTHTATATFTASHTPTHTATATFTETPPEETLEAGQ